MSGQDIQLLSAYMDGELLPMEEKAVEKRLDEDAAFRKLLQQLRQQDLYLRASVNAIERTPVKPELEKLLDVPANNGFLVDTTSNVVSLLGYRIKRLAAIGIPAAAVLFLIVFWVFIPGQEKTLEESDLVQGQQTPATISQVLDTLVAGESIHLENKLIHEILAFTRGDGVLCKHYVEKSSRETREAVSCYENERWMNVVVAVLNSPASRTGEEYVPADGGHSVVDVYIQKTIDGTALTVERERELMNKKAR